MFKTKRQRSFSVVVFAIYMLLLVWLILFKFATNLNDLGHIRNINVIPFRESMIVNGKLDLSEIIYNILVFIPLGVYIDIFKNDRSIIKKIIPCFCLSLLFESLQFIFAIGASDITDIIGNTLGGLIGIVICKLFEKIFKGKFITIINCIGLIIEILGLVMIGILLFANNA